MEFYAVNASPRKHGNTAVVLDYVLQGIRDTHTEAVCERIDLYDYTYTGCVSCFVCKRIGGKSFGKCAKKDELTEVIEKLSKADGIVFGSPIYFHDITAQLRALLERLLFAYHSYEKDGIPQTPKRMPTAFIYTMNVTEEVMRKMDYPNRLERMEGFVERIFTKPEVLYVNNTYQFDDYSKYAASRFDEPEKRKYREEYFPEDCRKAYELGKRMAEQNKS